LQELSAYLPYKLQMMSSDGQIGELIGFINEDSIIKRRVYVSGFQEMGIEDGYEIKEYRCCLNAKGMGVPNKPLLRRLHQLTQEIEHNGKRFVPIEEIAKIECPNITGAKDKIHSITKFNRGISFSSRQQGVTYKYEGVTVEITHFKDAI